MVSQGTLSDVQRGSFVRQPPHQGEVQECAPQASNVLVVQPRRVQRGRGTMPSTPAQSRHQRVYQVTTRPPSRRKPAMNARPELAAITRGCLRPRPALQYVSICIRDALFNNLTNFLRFLPRARTGQVSKRRGVSARLVRREHGPRTGD